MVLTPLIRFAAKLGRKPDGSSGMARGRAMLVASQAEVVEWSKRRSLTTACIAPTLSPLLVHGSTSGILCLCRACCGRQVSYALVARLDA
jgi:hypothetical protein